MTKRSWTPGRVRNKRQNRRAGNAGVLASSAVTTPVCFLLRAQGCGCSQAPGIPCALFARRWRKQLHSDAFRLRECVTMSAMDAVDTVPASAQKKSRKCRECMVGAAGFEPATPASRTQCTFSKLLIFLDLAGVSTTFCSRWFHPIRCDFVAAFSKRTALAVLLDEHQVWP